MPDPQTPQEALSQTAVAMLRALCDPNISDMDLAWAGFQAIAANFSATGDYTGASFAWNRFRRLVQK